jgi:PAS domain S-box-containing protein
MEELSASLIRDLLDSAPDATVIANQHGNIVLANSQIENVFGYTPGELVGMPIEVLLPKRFRNNHISHRDAYFRTAKPRPMGAGLELYGLRKNGEEFPVEISLGPVQTEDGVFVSSAIRDITERKQVEQALIDARNEANKANRAKSAFLATASHDLRQPMQTLKILNHALGKMTTDANMLQAIHTQADALHGMTELLNALLDMSKLESGAVKPDIHDCSVKAIFKHLRAQFEQQAQAKGLKLLVDECDDVGRTDPGLLEQLIQNLVANAIRYTKQGLVQLRCLHNGGLIRIEVLDTGIGIPVTQLESIWDEFYQVGKNPHEPKEGWGLGLSIVKRLADLLNHPLEIDSRPGEGSCFAVTIPAGNKETTRSAETTMIPQTTSPEDATVIVIDDNQDVLKANRLLFEVEGYSVLAAASGADALGLLENCERPPNVIVSDFHLANNEKGTDVIRSIRTKLQSEIPAILMTGDTTSIMRDVKDILGNCHVVSKPADIPTLVALLSNATKSGKV